MDTDTDASGLPACQTEGGDPNWAVHFGAELRRQLDEGGTLFGDDADGTYWAVHQARPPPRGARHGRARAGAGRLSAPRGA